jgi:hypothetical protein
MLGKHSARSAMMQAKRFKAVHPYEAGDVAHQTAIAPK